MAINIKENIKQVRRRITVSAKKAGRSSDEIQLIAVSKTHSPRIVRQAVEAGVKCLGENKIQEAETKVPEVGRDGFEWHLIGHLQKNKARKAVQIFDVVHTLDAPELAHRLERLCEEVGRRQLRVLVQVDIAGEESKSGIAETQLPMLVEALKRAERLRFDGLMVIPPYSDDPEELRPYFQRLREIRDRLAREGAFQDRIGELSMGMSHDLEVAIEEGATMLRVGTAIFGERKKPAV